MFRKQRQGQTFIEYTLLVGVLVTVLIAMTPMMRRGIQALVKVTADQVGTQQNAEQVAGRFGHMINATTYTKSQQAIVAGERLGVTSKDYSTVQDFTQSSLYLNQGFAEKQ